MFPFCSLVRSSPITTAAVTLGTDFFSSGVSIFSYPHIPAACLQEIADDAEQKEEVEMVNRRSALFDSIFDVKVHEALCARGERRWSHRAFQGALMVSFYR